jgi:hypothetical protein
MPDAVGKMLTIRTKAHVSRDGTLEVKECTKLPPGEHEAVIVVAESPTPAARFTLKGFPIHSEPWDDSVSLRREDMYGADGR